MTSDRARLPRSVLAGVAEPLALPTGCQHAAQIEAWHGREVERETHVTEYRVYALGPLERPLVARCLRGDLLRIADMRGRPIPREARLWPAATTIASLWKTEGLHAIGPYHHEAAVVERRPYSTYKALWRAVLEGVWRLLALLYHAWERDTAPLSRKGVTLRAEWVRRDDAAIALWHRLRRRSVEVLREVPAWPWWESFLVEGPHHGALTTLPVISWSGRASIVQVLADRYQRYYRLITESR